MVPTRRRSNAGGIIRNRSAIRRGLAAVLAVLIASGALVASEASPSHAADGSRFDAGNIISDRNFFDDAAMTQAQIQSFLDARIGRCSNANCLNVLRVNTPNEAAAYSSRGEVICGQYTGVQGELASSILFKVQQACRVSAKVLLVTLQKEQSLVTATGPSDGKLERAMGYGCPDSTGGTCAEQYYGFYNQVMNAAWQLRRYGTEPVFGRYQVGWNDVQWNPNAACGSSQVYISNRATAALYNYTPYRPNGAALANLYGTGDDCSSYGNRNFWVYYNDWFGDSTQPPGTPEGELTLTPGVGTIGVSGWAVDPDSVRATVAVSVQIDSTWQALMANRSGQDRGARYPGAGSSHDFAGTFPASPGNHSVCVYLVNAGGSGATSALGCRDVTVSSSAAPQGAITTAVASGTTVSFTGWAVQPDRLTAAVPIAVNVGDSWLPFVTGLPNSAAPKAVPGAGPNQGFAGSFEARPGLNTFCVWAARQIGPAEQIGCRSIVVRVEQPSVSLIEGARATSDGLEVSGYAIWTGSLSQAVPVAINVGSSWFAATANKPSSSGQAAVSGAGPNHGFSARVALPPGQYSACVWVAQPTGPAISIGCRTVTVAGSSGAAQGAIETIAVSGSSANVSGWAVWPGRSDAVPVAVNVGSNWYALLANQPSASAQAAVPGSSGDHGYAGSVPLSIGQNSVCVWVANPSGPATQLGCQQVERAESSTLLGALTVLTGGVGGLHYEGWAVAPDSPEATVSLALNVGSTWTAIQTGRPNSDAPESLSGAGPNQGFAGLLPTPIGAQTLCVWAAGENGPRQIGCKSASVVAAPAVSGGLVAATAVAGGVRVEGWAAWPGSAGTPVPVAVNIGNQWTAIPANLASSVPLDYVLGAGPNQGFDSVVPAPSGSASVCIWASAPSGPAVALGCLPVTVP